MNIYDIAKKAGVSVATVSRVINNSGSVSAKTKSKIEKIMQQESYVPNVFARGLNLNSIKTVGILCPTIADINHAKPVSIVEKLLRERGFDSLLCCIGSNEEDKSKYLKLLFDKKVDAIVVISSTIKEAAENEAFRTIAQHVPIIIINGLIKLPNVYCVLCDEESAIFDAVGYLAAKQCRDIVYIADSNTYAGYQKVQGYKKGLAAHGIPENPNLLIKIPDVGNEIDLAYEAMTKLIKSKVKISAVMGADDTVAIGALKALKENGISVPIIGFNNTEFAKCSTPTLTSIDNMMPLLCSTAIKILFDVLNGRDAVSKVVISAKFVERESFKLN
ncbi:MAG: LacI family DNA-binding transcriptional regulator [Acetivibrionales bacterium]|jgi:LacI family transcriptional regulator